MRRQIIALVLSSPLIVGAAPANDVLNLEGTWVMESAFEILANGGRVTNYGDHPNGLMLVDREGRYSIQIFRPDRPKFQSGDKTRGEPEEYRAAVLGSSTHFGRVKVDPLKQQLLFRVDAASFPNWEGKQQLRNYNYTAGVLTYAVPAGASGNGTTAWSIWRKVSDRR